MCKGFGKEIKIDSPQGFKGFGRNFLDFQLISKGFGQECNCLVKDLKEFNRFQQDSKGFGKEFY